MKKKIFFMFFCIAIYANAQQIEKEGSITFTKEASAKLEPLITIDAALYKNNILYDKVMPLAQLNQFNDLPDAITHPMLFRRAWQELYNARITATDKHISSKELEAIANYSQQNGIIQLGIINTDFTQLKESVLTDIQEEKTSITLLAKKREVAVKSTILVDSPYEDKHLFMVSPLTNTAIQTTINTDVLFEIGQLGLNQSIQKIKSLHVVYEGEATLLIENDKIIKSKFTQQFSTSGVKTMQFNAVFTSGKKLGHSAKFMVAVKTTASKEANTPIEIIAEEPFRGYDEPEDCGGTCFGYGEYQIFLSTKNTKLKRPIIILDGFDPGDKRQIDNGEYGIVNLINNDGEEPNMSKFSDAGFDVVILNFPNKLITVGTTRVWIPWLERYVSRPIYITRDGGSDYIERNANILKTLIVALNTQLVENDSDEKLKIIGPSMGGLISRVALTEMEQANQDHNVDTWVSFDSPHLGANIPIGLQYFFNYMDLPQVESFKTPAAKQILLTQVVDETYATRIRFRNKLASLGFPQKTRNLALINGSIKGVRPGTPKGTMLNIDFKAFAGLYNISIKTYASHDDEGESHEVFKYTKETLLGIRLDSPKIGTLLENSSSGSLDNSSGGYYDIKTVFEKSLGVALPLTNWNAGDAINELLSITDNPTRSGIDILTPIALFGLGSSIYLDVLQGKPTFIPSKSGLAFTGSNKLFHENLSNRNLVCTNETPFDSYYAPNNNEEHVTLNSENIAWVLEELIGNEQPAYSGSVVKIANVLPNITDIENTASNIIANNIIWGKGTANYIGTSISLKPGFHTKSGANFNASTQNCVSISLKSSNTNAKEIYEYPKVYHITSENNLNKTEELEPVITDENGTLSIFPNPTTGNFTISSNETITNYKMFNLIGAIVLNKKVNANTVTVTIQNLPQGIYMANITLASGEIIMKKIIKN